MMKKYNNRGRCNASTHLQVPKSTIESYNGAELRLNISYDELETDEVKDDIGIDYIIGER